ncbi:GIY-YIG nuclease family protein [Candidatus Uhrbacteria bacterium]|jgi:putative endonuclease|nr:GIY-YIG nuclease family protein [Candidatus Uhrbacteria bacterium]
MYFVYVLFCSDDQLYIGYSTNLKDRLRAHESGSVKSTKHRLPAKIFYYENYKNKNDAMAREVYLKSGGGHREFKRQHQHELKRLGYKHL